MDYTTDRDLASLAAGTGTPLRLRLLQLAPHPMPGYASLVETPTMRALVVKIQEAGFLTNANTEQGEEMIARWPNDQ